MGLTNFYVGGGSNLNAGSTIGTSPVYSSTSGNFDGTSVYTPTDGQTTSSLVATGDWVAVFPSAASVTPCIAQVVTVGAGVNGTITVSTTIKFGTLPGAVACKCRAGGAFADLAITATSTPFTSGVTAPISIQVNLLAATYANTTSSRSLGPTGSALVAVIWSGYKTSINDQDTNVLAVAGTDIPHITFTTATMSATSNFVVMRNLAVTSASTANPAATCGGGNAVINCQFNNTGANAASTGLSLTATGSAIACYIKSTATATAAFKMAAANCTAAGCYVTGGAAESILVANGVAAIFNTVVDSAAGDALSTSVSIFVCGLSVYAPLGNGINFTTVAASIIANSYFSTVNQASKAAINNTSGTNTYLIRVVGCAYFNCTATLSGFGDYPEYFSAGTIGSEGFEAPASQNFMPLAPLQTVGFPANVPTLGFRGYSAIGALAAANANRSRAFSGF